VITKKSGLIKKAIRDICEDDYTKAIDLSHLDPDVFAMYLEAAYVGKILPEKIESLDRDICNTLCRIYVIAEEMMDPATKNVTLRDLDRAMSARQMDGQYPFPTNHDIEVLYRGTRSSENKGRQFLVSRWMSRTKPNIAESELITLPPGFVYEAVKKLMEQYTRYTRSPDSVDGFIEREDDV
jgi:hypothetical protein